MIETGHFALRSLRRSPGFALLIFSIIAISIAACCCVFSILYVQVLKPIAFDYPEQLVRISPDPAVTIHDYKEWIRPAQNLESIAAYKIGGFQLRIGDERMRFSGYYVTSSFFSVLKARPILGPGFSAANDLPGSEPVVIIGNNLWKRSFQGDKEIIGKQIALNTILHTIVGVMPKDFDFGNFLWVPMSGAKSGSGIGNKVFLLGTMKPGISEIAAIAELSARAKGIQGNTAGPVSVTRYSRGPSEYGGVLTLLFCATLLVLLIACLNVGNLVLMRTAARQKEIAIHMALGASTASMIRHTFVEMIFLFLPAAVAGLLLGSQSLQLLEKQLPYYLSGSRSLTFNFDLWLFSVLLSIFTGAICSLFPVVRLRNARLVECLKEGGQRSATDRRGARLRPFVVVLQIALGMLLLTGAGLLLRSLMNLYQVKPGFESSNILTAHVTLPLEKYPKEGDWTRTYQQILQKLKDQPGIVSAAITTNLPLRGSSMFEMVQIEPSSQPKRILYRDATPDYFSILKIKLLSGRYFNDRDTTGNRPVVIVNESMAKLIGTHNVLGKYVLLGEDSPIKHQIVGVVADIKHSGLNQPVQPEIAACMWQHPWRWGSVLVKTSGAPLGYNAAFLNAIWAVDPDQPIIASQTMEDVIADSVEDFRFVFVLLSIFAGLALLILLFGIYAVLAYSVTERNHEIGIRMALGARPQNIFRMIYKEGSALLTLGIAVGILLGLGTLHVLKSYLFEVKPLDPATLIVVIAGILLVGFCAVFFPSLRAIRTDPLNVLRNS